MPFGGLLTVGLIGAGASIFGGVEQSNAAGDAADAQRKAEEQFLNIVNQSKDPLNVSASVPANQANPTIDAGTDLANRVLGQYYERNIGLLQPYLDAGSTAEGQLSQGLQPGGVFNSNPSATDILSQDPGYQFRLQQGQQALERSAAAKGGATSGGALKALTQYGQDYGSAEYNNAFQRYNTTQGNLFNRLQSVAQGGLSASQTGVGTGTATGAAKAGNITQGARDQAGNLITGAQMNSNDILSLLGLQGNAITGAANATASGYIGQGNAISGAASGVGGAATNALILQKLLAAKSPGGATDGW
jgi:hypothetical protein